MLLNFPSHGDAKKRCKITYFFSSVQVFARIRIFIIPYRCFSIENIPCGIARNCEFNHTCSAVPELLLNFAIPVSYVPGDVRTIPYQQWRQAPNRSRNFSRPYGPRPRICETRSTAGISRTMSSESCSIDLYPRISPGTSVSPDVPLAIQPSTTAL